MKKRNYLTLLFIAGVNASGFSQEVNLIEKNEKIIFNNTKSYKMDSVNVTVEYWSTNLPVANDKLLTFTIDDLSRDASVLAPAILNPKQKIDKDQFAEAKNKVTFSLQILLQPGGERDDNKKYSFTIKLTEGKDVTIPVNVSIDSSIQSEKKTEEDTVLLSNIMFFNGMTFDFNADQKINYIGVVRVFYPDLFQSGNWEGGLDAGITKINYSLGGDSINNSIYRYENTLMHPLDSVKAGSKYLRQFNRYSTIAKNVSYSIYAQPMIGVFSDDKKVSVLLHAHFELLLNKWNIKTTVSNIQQDTSTISQATGVYSVINKFPQSTLTDNVSSADKIALTEYVGIGTTFLIQPSKTISLFIQPTFGVALNFGQPTSFNPATLQTGSYPSTTQSFYLTRFHIQANLTKQLGLVIGGVVRGYFTANAPSTALFVGVNLGLYGIKKAFNSLLGT